MNKDWKELLLAKDSPFWPIARVVAITLCAAVTLWVVATNFDMSEIEALAAIAGGAGLIELLKRKLASGNTVADVKNRGNGGNPPKEGE